MYIYIPVYIYIKVLWTSHICKMHIISYTVWTNKFEIINQFGPGFKVSTGPTGSIGEEKKWPAKAEWWWEVPLRIPSWWCRRQHSRHLNPLFTARTSVAQETTHFRWPGINHYCHMAASKNGGVFLLLAYLKHDIAWWILYWCCVCVLCMFENMNAPRLV